MKVRNYESDQITQSCPTLCDPMNRNSSENNTILVEKTDNLKLLKFSWIIKCKK